MLANEHAYAPVNFIYKNWQWAGFGPYCVVC